MIQDGVNLATGDKDDDSLNKKNRAGAVGESREEVTEKPHRKGSEKHSGIHSEEVPTELGSAKGDEDRDDPESPFVSWDFEGDAE